MNTPTEALAYAKTVFLAAFSPSTFKMSGAVLYVMLSFLFDIQQTEAYISLAILIIFDFITSIWATKQSGEPIISSRIWGTAIKFVMYFMLVSGAYQAERGLVNAIGFLDETVLGFLLLREFISLLENFGKMGYQTPLKLLNQLKKISEDKYGVE